MMSRIASPLLMALCAAQLAGCAGLDRLAEVGSPPRMSQIADVRRPSEIAAIRYPVPDAPVHSAIRHSLFLAHSSIQINAYSRWLGDTFIVFNEHSGDCRSPHWRLFSL